MTQELSLRESRLDFWLSLVVDALTAYLLTFALSFALLDILAIENTAGQSALLALGCLLLVFICARRWWVLPVLLGAAAFLLAIVFLLYERSDLLAEHWRGFLLWVESGLAPRDPYSYNGSIWIVKAMLTFPLCFLAYGFARRFFSFLALSLISGAAVIAVFFINAQILDLMMALLFGALILTLPRLICRHINRTGKGAIPRWSMQLIGIPAAVLCVCLSLVTVPQGEDVWRNPTLNRFLNDVNDVIDYYWGTSANGTGTVIDSYGFMPLEDRLGGDIVPQHTELANVFTDAPTYLRTTVYDAYDGRAWYDAQPNGHFRLGSIFWQSRRTSAFGNYLPVGGREASALYEDITTDLIYRVVPKQRRLRSYLIAGNMSRVRGLDGRAPVDPYFNLQSEVYDRGWGYVTGYSVNAYTLDRDAPDFSEKLYRITELARGLDRHYPDIVERYRPPYDGLPDSVTELVASITAGLERDYDKAVAIERWLGEECRYTLTPGAPPEDEDFVGYFLKTREGYCTYFASAMTMMARSVDLPARYVTGFGLKKSLGNEKDRYAILTSGAHAWCEIYFEGAGWVSFDPLIWDYAYPQEEKAQMPIGSSSLEPEPEREEESRTSGIQSMENLSRVPQARPDYSGVLVIAIALALLIIACYVGYRLLMGRKFHLYALDRVRRRFGDDGCVGYYFRDIMKQMEFWRVSIDGGETLAAYCTRCDRYIKVGKHGMERIGEIVSRHFYGGKELTRDDLRALYFIHDDLENQLKHDLGTFKYFFMRAIS